MQELEQKDIIELIAGYLTGQSNDEQFDALNAWIKADRRNKQYFDDMRELWLAAPVAFPGKPFHKEAAYRLFLSRSRKKVPVKPVKERPAAHIRLVRMAAAVVAGFMLGAFYVFQTNKPDVPSQVASQYDVIVPHGSRSRVVLADGTGVWLNAGSRLRYATDFGQNSREVYLEGEGYFDVAKDTARVFVVKTDKLDIKALGTSFNVKAYPGEENIETVLIEGKVSIGDVELAPSEKLVYTRKDQKTVIEKKAAVVKPAANDVGSSPVKPSAKVIETPVDPTIYTSWKDDLWRIESETLGSFAVKLERRYDVKIRFADRGTQSLSINAAIRDESLEQVLRFLQLTVPVKFEIDGKTVVLKEDKYLKERYKGYYKQK
jgi:ferric-dicitrate binding protein FerR (iron transport regulator)